MASLPPSAPPAPASPPTPRRAHVVFALATAGLPPRQRGARRPALLEVAAVLVTAGGGVGRVEKGGAFQALVGAASSDLDAPEAHEAQRIHGIPANATLTAQPDIGVAYELGLWLDTIRAACRRGSIELASWRAFNRPFVAGWLHQEPWRATLVELPEGPDVMTVAAHGFGALDRRGRPKRTMRLREAFDAAAQAGARLGVRALDWDRAVVAAGGSGRALAQADRAAQVLGVLVVTANEASRASAASGKGCA